MSAPDEPPVPPGGELPVPPGGEPPATRPRQPRNPLHGVTLEHMVTDLAADLGWEALGRRIPIRCFTSDPSVASSLKFLRRTPWARAEVEALYLAVLRQRGRPGRG